MDGTFLIVPHQFVQLYIVHGLSQVSYDEKDALIYRFPHAMWNMNLRVQNDLPRTNNDLEGWYNRFPGAFQRRHTHIWKLIKWLQNDSALNHHSMAQLLAWAEAQPQRKKYIVNDR